MTIGTNHLMVHHKTFVHSKLFEPGLTGIYPLWINLNIKKLKLKKQKEKNEKTKAVINCSYRDRNIYYTDYGQ
ncbi:hypothetical protein Lalb_Chr21g0306221 [Lupinus albus]|uniref:Uncharacterized protein n=1 Tax=Lupinus albus TaxID=3870 RepID=A0A6A4NJY4_LUPAL|nr:hypothetical protein Lalb_Chr21g0306221 [Lupinus albus]